MAREAQSRLEELNVRFRRALVSYFHRRVRDHAEAEDLTQEVFLRLARTDSLEKDAPHSYVFQVATNLLRDRARRLQVRSSYVTSLRHTGDGDVDFLDPAMQAEARSELATLENLVAALPERMRNAFLLYRFEGIGKALIAESLGVSVSTVEKDVAAALLILGQKLGRVP